MSQPWGYNDRDKPGLRGWLARRWFAHRVKVVKKGRARFEAKEAERREREGRRGHLPTRRENVRD